MSECSAGSIDTIKKRIDWIDIAKGFTILLVIIGHGSISDEVRGVIFSFHMPLFFIVSCVTFKLSETNDDFVKKTEKAFVHLFLPAFGIFFLRWMITFAKDFFILQIFDLGAVKENLASNVSTFFMGSGVDVIIGGATIPAIGIPWFLMVLFFGRTLYDYFHLKLKGKAFIATIVISSIVGVCFGMIQWLPFSFDIAFAIQPLFVFGQWLKRFDMETNAKKTCIISLASSAAIYVVICFITGTYLELACRRYPAYPLCFLCAIAGTMFICSFSQIFSNLKTLSIPIKYLGKNSMYMLWIHCFDGYLAFAYNITPNGNVNTMMNVMVDIVVFIIVMTIVESMKRMKHRKSD